MKLKLRDGTDLSNTPQIKDLPIRGTEIPNRKMQLTRINAEKYI